MDIKIEMYDHDRHYLRFAPLFARYFLEVNGEDAEEEIPVVLNGKKQLVRRLDVEIHSMAMNGVFSKVAIVDEEIVGFIWYRGFLHHMIVPIDAFYVRRPWRRARIAQALLNSFCNDFNRGWFEIVAFIHEKKRPEDMLAAFHGWEWDRVTNDRDLVMIRGKWDVHLYQKDEIPLSGEVPYDESLRKPKKDAGLRLAQSRRRPAGGANGGDHPSFPGPSPDPIVGRPPPLPRV